MEADIKFTQEEAVLLLNLIRTYPLQGNISEVEQVTFRLRLLEKKIADPFRPKKD